MKNPETKKTTQKQNLPGQPTLEILINTALETVIGWKALPFCTKYQVATVKNGASQLVETTDRTFFKIPSRLIESEPCHFTVRGVNNAGEGQWAEPVLITRPQPSVPPTPAPVPPAPPTPPPPTPPQPQPPAPPASTTPAYPWKKILKWTSLILLILLLAIATHHWWPQIQGWVKSAAAATPTASCSAAPATTPPDSKAAYADGTVGKVIGCQTADKIENNIYIYPRESVERKTISTPREDRSMGSTATRIVRLPCQDSVNTGPREITTTDTMYPGEIVLYIAEPGWDVTPTVVASDVRLSHEGKSIGEMINGRMHYVQGRLVQVKLLIQVVADHPVPITFTLKQRYSGMQ